MTRRAPFRFRSRRSGSRLLASLGGEQFETRRLLAVANIPVDEQGLSSGCPVCGGQGCTHQTAPDGQVFMQCAIVPTPAAAATPVGGPARAVTDLVNTFRLSSLPSASKKIFLDFDGHVATNTIWQRSFGYPEIVTPSFSLDAAYDTFSDSELTLIQEIWARVAEDFSPFQVDVTTMDPGLDALTRSGSADTTWGMRIVIGGTGAWMGGAAGVAVLNSFGATDGTPAFSFADQWWKNDGNLHSTIISHELGHTLGLRHDGYNGAEYYGGRGTGATSWGPIMGNPSTSVTQWSNGDYAGSTNREDDLSVITSTRNGFGYRTDDHGGTTQTATVASGSDFTFRGVIERSSDIDMFRFPASGAFQATVSSAAFGANLDILATLLDSSGNVVATSNPSEQLSASFSLTLSPGTYYLSVRGTGYGNPNTTGYSNYGSLGQYTVSVGDSLNLSVSDASVLEGNSGSTTASVAVRLSRPATTPVTVNVATANGTATTADSDFVSSSETLRFAVGEIEKTFTVSVRGDSRVEPDETFFVRLSGASGAEIGDGEGIVTIVNDDQAVPTSPPTLAVEDIRVIEGNSGTRDASFTVTLSRPSDRPVRVRYATADGSAAVRDADYVARNGVLTFVPGETSKTIVVHVRSDPRVESDETFSLQLSGVTNAVIGRGQATATIVNDDTAPSQAAAAAARQVALPAISIADARAAEGDRGTSQMVFEISLSSPATSAVTVRYQASPGTAAARSDFTPVSGTVRFAQGESVKTVSVPIAGDRVAEADEAFGVSLSGARGATIARTQATGTILNDDATPTLSQQRLDVVPSPPRISIGDAEVLEGQSRYTVMIFTVTLSSPAERPISVQFRTVEGTASAGSDFVSATEQVRFARGAVSQTVRVLVRGDKAVEGDEAFFVRLSDARGADVARAEAVGRIINDDVEAAFVRVVAMVLTPSGSVVIRG